MKPTATAYCSLLLGFVLFIISSTIQAETFALVIGINDYTSMAQETFGIWN